MTKAGWKLLIVGAAKVVHRRHQTTGYTSPFITYYSVRNRLIFLTRYGRPLAVLKNAPFILRPLYWKVRRCGLTNMPRHRAFIRAIFDAGKPLGAICHAPWLLIEAGIAEGREMTSYKSIATDVKNAGAKWEDSEVVNDRALVTRRNPGDLPAFCDKLIEEIAEGRHTRRAA